MQPINIKTKEIKKTKLLPSKQRARQERFKYFKKTLKFKE
jgi:hypothetical protein